MRGHYASYRPRPREGGREVEGLLTPRSRSLMFRNLLFGRGLWRNEQVSDKND